MPDAKIVYRSTHPDVLAHWDRTGSAEAQRAWRDRVAVALVDVEFPGRRVTLRDGVTRLRVVGVEHPAGEPSPDGWRRDPTLPGGIVPRRTTRAGKAAAAVLDGLDRPDPRRDLPGGMPAMSWPRMTMLAPGVARYGDTVFVTWSAEPDPKDVELIDAAVWERVPMSAYWAAREAAEQTDPTGDLR